MRYVKMFVTLEVILYTLENVILDERVYTALCNVALILMKGLGLSPY